jgi:hypothetical protein
MCRICVGLRIYNVSVIYNQALIVKLRTHPIYDTKIALCLCTNIAMGSAMIDLTIIPRERIEAVTFQKYFNAVPLALLLLPIIRSSIK